MGLNADAVGAESEPTDRAWTSKDALLYAVGVGAGSVDPAHELEFTTENSHDVAQRVLPTMGVVLGAGNALAAVGDINWGLLLHGGQGVTLHRELPTDATVSCTARITGMWDKGEGKNAIIDTEIDAVDKETGEAMFTTRSSLVIRGSGGFGGEAGDTAPSVFAPDSAPEHEVTYTTREDQALTYRLSGDRNPLHSDPWFATELAKFPKPILHGLCTYGFTGRALLHTLADSDPSRFVSMDSRFSSPVFPGESLTTRMWRGDGGWIYQTLASVGTSNERVVIDNGWCVVR
ncbi:MAG: hypothetical protein GY708_14920 [Actinomycetia bacterium]|nr:hypothetical protein [Actinomycetes bacterium]